MLRSERGNPTLKILDRWIGIPVVFLLSLFRFRRQLPQNPSRIGLLIPAAIGDTIVASATFDALRLRFPNAEIVAFASPANISIFSLFSSLSRSICLPINKPWKAIAALRNEGQFDWWIDYGQWARLNAFYTFAAKAKFKVGFNTSGQFRHNIYDRAILHNKEFHELENFNALLSPFSVEVRHKPQIEIRAEVISKNQIVLHKFAGGSKPFLKEWPNENWKTLIDHLTERGFHIKLTGVSENKSELNELIRTLNNPGLVENTAGVWSLKKVAEEMKSSLVVISVNTGIMHLAAALGCNLVSLQGPTSVKRWGPTNKNAHAIQSSLKCSPCLNLGFEYGCPFNNCMKAITVEEVILSLGKFLK